MELCFWSATRRINNELIAFLAEKCIKVLLGGIKAKRYYNPTLKLRSVCGTNFQSELKPIFL